MEWLAKIISMLKLPIKFIFVIFFATFFFIFSPKNWQEKLNITNLREKLSPFIEIIFVFCFFILLVELADFIIKKINAHEKRKVILKKISDEIESFDDDEKAIIREFILQKKNAIEMPIDDPSVSRLISKGILVRVSDFVDPTGIGMLSPISVAGEVRKKIIPAQVDYKENPDKAAKIWMEDNRPLFMKQIRDRHLGY